MGVRCLSIANLYLQFSRLITDQNRTCQALWKNNLCFFDSSHRRGSARTMKLLVCTPEVLMERNGVHWRVYDWFFRYPVASLMLTGWPFLRGGKTNKPSVTTWVLSTLFLFLKSTVRLQGQNSGCEVTEETSAAWQNGGSFAFCYLLPLRHTHELFAPAACNVVQIQSEVFTYHNEITPPYFIVSRIQQPQ